MERTYEAMGRLVPNEAVAVLERDENGALVGAYKGYWNFKRGTVSLYPDMRHPFVHWTGTPVKKVVNDRFVRVRTDVRSSSSTAAGGPPVSPRARSQNGSDVINVIQDRSAASLPVLGKAKEPKGYERMTRQLKSLPIMGQEKMKF